jgi:hypothetical protein
LRSEGVGSFRVQEVKAKGEGEQWKILVIAKVAVDGLTVLCQNLRFYLIVFGDVK